MHKDLVKTTMSTFYKILSPQAYMLGGKRSDSEGYLRLNNGSEVFFMHMDDQDILGVLRGIEINWFLFDQAEEIEEIIFDVALSRLGRWDQAQVPDWIIAEKGGIENWSFKNPVTGRPTPPPYAMLACNPDVETHWIYRRFHPDSREWQTKWRWRGYKMITMASHENKYLPKTTLEEMRAKDDAFVRRFVEGQWGIPEGQIHVVDRLSILNTDPEVKDHPEMGVYVDGHALVEYFRRHCTLHRTLDHGDANPTVCLWWAVDPEGNLFCYREYYKPNALISDHRRNITEMSSYIASSGLKVQERYRENLADPSIFAPTMQKHGSRWSVADEYADRVNLPEETALVWTKGDNNELGTRNHISEYLRVDPERIHPILKTKGSPRIFFVMQSPAYPNGCYQAVVELKAQRRLKVGEENGRPIFSDERDPNIPDHAYDCVRYMVAARPPRARIAPQDMPHNCFESARRRLIKAKRKGSRRYWRQLPRHMSAY